MRNKVTVQWWNKEGTDIYGISVYFNGEKQFDIFPLTGKTETEELFNKILAFIEKVMP